MVDKSINTFNVSNVSEFNSIEISAIDIVNLDNNDCIIMSYADAEKMSSQQLDIINKVKERLKSTFPNNKIIAIPNWIKLSVVKQS